MSHVTVVEVHESHLKTYDEEAHLRRGPEAVAQHRVSQRQERLGTLHQDHHIRCPIPQTNHKHEAVYVNLTELQQQGKGNTVEARGHPTPVEECEIPEIHMSRRLVRKSSIIDQNVGVSGAVFMVSDPTCQQQDSSDDESDSSLTSSVSSLSESDSGLSSTIEVGVRPVPHHATTITIIEEQKLNNRVLLHITAAAEENGTTITRGTTTHEDPKTFSLLNNTPGENDNSSNKAVTLKWRVIPPPSLLPKQATLELEGDRGSTPTSFSSAYTVTENENESTGEDSDASRHNWSSQESDEEVQGILRAINHHDPESTTSGASEPDSLSWVGESECLPDGEDSTATHASCTIDHQILQPIRENARNIISLETGGASRRCELRELLCRLRHASDSSSNGEESIVYSYIPCRDQREKEDEELWVANEAADPGGVQSFLGVAPPLLPPSWGWGSSLSHESGKPELCQLTMRGPVWAEQLRAPHGCVTSPSCVSSLMCTLAPSLAAPSPVGTNTSPRKHYTNRQRVAESQIIRIVDEEPKYKQHWNKLSEGDTQIYNESTNLQTSTTTNMPTKRFSFLIRSNSMKQESVIDTDMVTPAHQPVTPSDQAILDKIATLNMEAPEIVIRPRPRCSLFDPPCVRCGEPVYLQERTEPTLRLVYHSSCFKCHKCGVRLALKTFFRSPIDSQDTRVFCRSHVPALDPGRLDIVRTDMLSSLGKCSPDSVGVHPDATRNNLKNNKDSTPLSLQDELDIVKCDTIGLRYF
ncbi:uncharacterized protein LOC121858203 isoform X1 [Homarus americanus]|uniref:uncharacterized protein LOC121858203 isoform X1 n=1 Tax=Homarus americanus TaxID=6706 RepID=UPI001C458096|nr:uncharacterized protein LOC121858203 isoform X1 [Homarus americanus]